MFTGFKKIKMGGVADETFVSVYPERGRMFRKMAAIVLSLLMIVTMMPVISGVEVASAEPSGTDLSGNIGTYEISQNGDYYLSGDVTGNIKVKGGVKATLDLNGHVLKGMGDTSVIINWGNLTIKDSGSATVHYFKYVKNGSWTLYGTNKPNSNNIIDIKDFTLDAVKDTSKTYYIRVKGGVITGGTGTYGSDVDGSKWGNYVGGGIVSTCSLTLEGGEYLRKRI